ncbi:MAG TPA: diguanylate cyclase [Capsulimonadaceae bacterium]
MIKRLLTGALIGLIVPVVATLAMCLQGAFSLSAFVSAQEHYAALWAADLTPVLAAIGYLFAAADPDPTLNSRSRQLPFFIAIIAAVPIALLAYACSEARMTASAMNYLEMTATLRSDSVAVYTSSNGLASGDWRSHYGKMDTTFRRLASSYPEGAAGVNSPWTKFKGQIESNGKVDWLTTSQLNSAAEKTANRLSDGVRQRESRAYVIFSLSLLALALFLVKCLKIVHHLRDVEQRIEWQNKELEDRNGRLETQQAEIIGREDQLTMTADALSDVNQLLQQASKRFEELFQSLPVACFCFDSDGRIFEWNRASEAQYGLSTERVFQQTLWDTVWLPEDTDRIKEVTHRVFNGEVIEGYEWKHVRADGTHCRVLTSTFPLRGSDGEIVGAICANVDITDLKLTQENLRDSEERFRSALHSMQEGLLLIDADQMVTLSNRTAELLLGVEDKTLVGRSVTDLGWRFIYENGGEASLETWPAQMTLDSGVTLHEVVLGLQKPGGRLAWLSLNCAPLFRADSNKPYAAVVTVTDITQRKHYEQKVREQMVMLNDAHAKLEIQQAELLEANAKLRALATLDGLTGLKNHRAFQERLEAEQQRSVRYGVPLSLILLDVDKFKVFNDTYGHPAGDEVLKTVARVLQQEARVTDFVARYGGEEFAIILTNTDYPGAMVVGERFRSAIESASWKDQIITASFGVSTLLPGVQSPADLISESDRGLYASKENGRNKVTHIFQVHDDEIRASQEAEGHVVLAQRRAA